MHFLKYQLFDIHIVCGQDKSMCSEVMQLFLPQVDIMLSASSISDKLAIPVDKIICVFATFQLMVN